MLVATFDSSGKPEGKTPMVQVGPQDLCKCMCDASSPEANGSAAANFQHDDKRTLIYHCPSGA